MNELPLTGSYRTRRASGFPSFAKAQLSQLRFKQPVESRLVVAARGSMLRRVSFYYGIYGSGDSPPSRRRGGRDLKKNAAKHPLRSGRGGCFKLPLIHPERIG